MKQEENKVVKMLDSKQLRWHDNGGSVRDFQNQSPEVLIGLALMNLCATYGPAMVRKTISSQMGMVVPRKKSQKKAS